MGEAGKRGGQEGGSERRNRKKKEASRKAQLRKLQSDGRCRKTRGGVTLEKGIHRACQKRSAIETVGENRRSESADLI